MFYLYILHSKSIDKFYVGYSSNIEERIKKHLEKHKGFTSKAKDRVVVYKEQYDSKEKAYAREREIKKWKSKKLIVELIKSRNK